MAKISSVVTFKKCFGKDGDPSQFTMQEISDAIYDVMQMETHNSITKAELVNCMKFCLVYGEEEHG